MLNDDRPVAHLPPWMTKYEDCLVVASFDAFIIGGEGGGVATIWCHLVIAAFLAAVLALGAMTAPLPRGGGGSGGWRRLGRVLVLCRAYSRRAVASQ